MKLLRNRKGQGMLEYVVIAAVAVGLAFYLYKTIKQPTTDKINSIASDMSATGHP